ncbi:MAG: 16S rRNA (uracil(1498)-N(3))-methyltransferase [Marinifilaceae bacterium]
MNLFYTPDITSNEYQLNEVESKHCVKVLRLKEGDFIYLIDGKGGFYKAEIVDAHPKRCMVECLEIQKEYGKRDFYLHLALAPTKNIDRTEWFLEKCTEIGADEFTPLLCQHSERKVVKTERLFKVITSAVKQSLKAYHPVLNEMTPFKKLVQKPFDGEKYIAHCNEGEKTNLKQLYSCGQNALILIGPEGDFSPEEVELAKENGFREISLGSSRLRTETAGVVACHTVSLANES